jgi:hypothetical protein
LFKKQITKKVGKDSGLKKNKNVRSKRDGHKEPVMFWQKITDTELKKLCYGLNDLVDAAKVAMRVIEGQADGVSRLN